MDEEKVRRDGESIEDWIKRVAVAEPGTEHAEPPPDLGKDLIPEIENTLSPERIEVDKFLDGITIVQAYNKWSGKPQINPTREESRVSCPVPGHIDSDPSCSLNTSKGTWNCFACGIGGDKFALGAVRFGYDINTYQSKNEFPALVQEMIEDLGYVVKVQGKDEWLERTPAETPVTSEPAAEPVVSDIAPTETPQPAQVAPEPAPEANPYIKDSPNASTSNAELGYVDPDEWPTFDWRNLPATQGDSFLNTWMQQCSTSYEPEEFYFWLGLMALGAAGGRKVTMMDSVPVRPNFMVTLVGASGTGKSIAVSKLDALLNHALPWMGNSASSGVKIIGGVGSGEALLDEFVQEIEVLGDPDKSKAQVPVNGLVKEDELASLVKKISRQGNITREIIMSFYDRDLRISHSSRTSGSVVVENHFFQLVATTQPRSLRNVLSRDDAVAGFLNRWTYVYGATKDRPPFTLDRIDVSPAVIPLQKIHTWGSGGRIVQWEDGPASDKFIDFYYKSIRPLQVGEDPDPMAGRLDLLAKKILLTLAMNDKSTTVLEEHVDTLIALWRYILRCYSMVGESIGGTPEEDCMNMIMAYLKERPQEAFTSSEIHHRCTKRLYDFALTKRCVDLLGSGGYISEVPRVKGQYIPRYHHNSGDSEESNVTQLHPV